MKKIICIACLLTIGISFGSCSIPESTDQPIVIPIPEEYTVLDLYDYDCTGRGHQVEFQLQKVETIKEWDTDKKESFEMFGQQNILYYDCTEIGPYYQDRVERYSQHSDTIFHWCRKHQFLESIEQVCNDNIHSFEEKEPSKQRSRDECYDLALKQLQTFVPDADTYTLVYDERSSYQQYKQYHFRFAKCVNGITLNSITIGISDHCDCCLEYRHNYYGVSEEIILPPQEVLNEIEAKVQEKLNYVNRDLKERYSLVEFIPLETILVRLSDGRYALEYFTDVNYDNIGCDRNHYIVILGEP